MHSHVPGSVCPSCLPPSVEHWILKVCVWHRASGIYGCCWVLASVLEDAALALCSLPSAQSCVLGVCSQCVGLVLCAWCCVPSIVCPFCVSSMHAWYSSLRACARLVCPTWVPTIVCHCSALVFCVPQSITSIEFWYVCLVLLARAPAVCTLHCVSGVASLGRLSASIPGVRMRRIPNMCASVYSWFVC